MNDNRKKMIYEVKDVESANKHEQEGLNNNAGINNFVSCQVKWYLTLFNYLYIQ